MSSPVIWIDDVRNPPADLVCDIARSYNEAIALLTNKDYRTVYIDHDLGDVGGVDHREYSGYDVMVWLAERAFSGISVPKEYHILSSNPSGRIRIQGVIDRYLTQTW